MSESKYLCLTLYPFSESKWIFTGNSSERIVGNFTGWLQGLKKNSLCQGTSGGKVRANLVDLFSYLCLKIYNGELSILIVLYLLLYLLSFCGSFDLSIHVRY